MSILKIREKAFRYCKLQVIVPQWQYAKIKRFDLRRTINVTSELRADGNASAITNEITPWLEEQKANWPTGYRYEFGGDAKQSAESMGSVIGYLPISAFCDCAVAHHTI